MELNCVGILLPDDKWAEQLAALILHIQNRARLEELKMTPEQWVIHKNESFKPWESDGWRFRLRRRWDAWWQKRREKKKLREARSEVWSVHDRSMHPASIMCTLFIPHELWGRKR